MRHFLILVLVLFFGSIKTFGQVDSVCAVKIGSNYYINCKKIISYDGQPVLTITSSMEPLIKINFDVFSKAGTKVAEIVGGKMLSGNKGDFTILLTEHEFSCVEKSTHRIICYVKKMYDEKRHRCELQVSADMYMPSGFCFQCTPETTNVDALQWMIGSTFSNSESAIDLK